MPSTSDVRALPGFNAIDALTVLANERRCASIQITDTYFDRQQEALRDVGFQKELESRRQVSQESRDVWTEITVDFESLTRRNLREASERLRTILQRLPEVQYLKRSYPETCFVVPEWLRTPSRVKYGARVYFFADESPSPRQIIEKNVEATVNETREEFERYQGNLHGYPDCCIEYYQESTRTDGSSPEYRSIEPLEKCVNDQALRRESASSLDDVLPKFFENPHSYAFFAHELYPEPECASVRERGVTIYETLTDLLPEQLVRDYFRVNFGWSYLMAQSVRDRSDDTPGPGSFGREHLLVYLPLQVLLMLPRYCSE